MIINTDKTKGMLLQHVHAKQSKLTTYEGKDLNITMQGKQIKNAASWGYH